MGLLFLEYCSCGGHKRATGICGHPDQKDEGITYPSESSVSNELNTPRNDRICIAFAKQDSNTKKTDYFLKSIIQANTHFYALIDAEKSLIKRNGLHIF